MRQVDSALGIGLRHGMNFIMTADRCRHFLLGIGHAFLTSSPMKQRRMNVTKLLNLMQGRAFGQQILLCLHDLRSLYIAELIGKILADSLQTLSCSKSSEVAFQLLRARVFSHRAQCFSTHHGLSCPNNLKTLLLQSIDNGFHFDAMHACSLRNGYQFAHRIAQKLLPDIGQSEARQHLNKLRILGSEVVNRAR